MEEYAKLFLSLECTYIVIFLTSQMYYIYAKVLMWELANII